MKVTGIAQSKRVPERYYLTLEDETVLRVNVALIADYSLFTGRELSPEETEALKKDAGRMNTRARALRIIGSRAMSVGELTSRLEEKGESPEDAEEAADWLESMGLINDREYAGMVVRHYAGKGYGLGRVKQELGRRKVPRDLWDEALGEYVQPEETVDRLVQQKLRGKEITDKELKRVSDMLLRRGYGWEDVKGALGRYREQMGEEL